MIFRNTEGARIGHGIGGFTGGYDVAFQALWFARTIGTYIQKKIRKFTVSFSIAIVTCFHSICVLESL